MNFVYQSYPNKVYFGETYLNTLPDIVKELGGTKLFIIAELRATNEAIIDNLTHVFEAKNVVLFSEIIQHVPKNSVEKALIVAKKHHSDILIAIGGGLGLYGSYRIEKKWWDENKDKI